MNIRIFLVLLAAGSLVMACQAPAPDLLAFEKVMEEEGDRFDLWIRGGLVLDGQSETLQRADILVSNGAIRYLGPVDTSAFSASVVIDASGRTVTPGFIDVHAHGDPLSTPAFRNFLAMGVTTICLGQDGASPPEKDLRRWMQQVEDTIPGVNIALFVGHGTLRQLSGVGYAQVPDHAGLKRMKELLRDALAAGCFGLSTGLEYTPGAYAGDAELLELAKIVGENGALIMSHIRNEDDDAVEDALRELLRQGQFCDVHASHLKVVYGKGEQRAEEILGLLDSARRRSKFQVTADVYPYTASYTSIGIVFPDWAKAPNDYATVRRQRGDELLGYLRRRIMARKGPGATLFGTPPYEGKTLQEVADEQDLPFEEVLLKIGPTGASGAYFVMDETLQRRLLKDPFIMVSSDGSPTMHHPRGYGSFAKIIEQYVVEEQLLSLPEAIRKMTSLPAATIGLPDRGTLAPGQAADILIFYPDSVRAHATFSQPHRPARGFDYVIVNGEVVLEKGGFPNTRSGVVVRKR